MISALVGSVIMTGVTLAMLSALKITDGTMSKVGKYQLTKEEEQILRNVGFDDMDIETLNQEIKSLKFNE